MAFQAQVLIDRAARGLNDPSNSRWPIDELLEYISDAQRATVLLRPEANPIIDTVKLVAGVRQTIPADGFTLLTITRNMGTDGTTPGPAIGSAARGDLDIDRSWTTQDPAAVVANFNYDVRARKTFYVSPPQPAAGQGQVELIYSKVPDDIDSATDTMALDEIYIPTLHSYVMHCAFLKDMPVQGHTPEVANLYFERFMTLLLGRADENESDIVVTQEVTTAQDRGSYGRGRRR
ncbi:DUF6682 family protein [Candidatus Poriferisocius sp.]|uniref:phage adaptor protein n=1 Tax=Candidatus Poriferisocius sp. TaxID=3101276 RepID=UPI003B022779